MAMSVLMPRAASSPAELLDLGLDLAGHAHRVGAGLPPHLQGDAGLLVALRVGAQLLQAILGLAHIPQPYGQPAGAAGLGNDQLIQLLGAGELGLGAGDQLLRAGLDAPAGHLHMLAEQGGADVLHGEVVLLEAQRVEPEPELALLAADDLDRAHIADALQALLDELVGDVVKLARAQVPREHDGEDGR
jgi:hypothetical protein